MMSALYRKVTFLLFLLFLAGMSLFGQAANESPYNVNGPADKVSVAWYETPILWVGLVIFGLALVLYFLRSGKSATKKSLHKY